MNDILAQCKNTVHTVVHTLRRDELWKFLQNLDLALRLGSALRVEAPSIDKVLKMFAVLVLRFVFFELVTTTFRAGGGMHVKFLSGIKRFFPTWISIPCSKKHGIIPAIRIESLIVHVQHIRCHFIEKVAIVRYDEKSIRPCL